MGLLSAQSGVILEQSFGLKAWWGKRLAGRGVVGVRLPRTPVGSADADDGPFAGPVAQEQAKMKGALGTSEADEGAFAVTIAQERAKIHRRRRLAERAGTRARESASSTTRVRTVRRGKRTTTRSVRVSTPPLKHCSRMVKPLGAALVVVLSAFAPVAATAALLVPMDFTQTDHLRAYGLAYWCLERGQSVEWLLNYRGGSFLLNALPENEREARIKGVLAEEVSGADLASMYSEIEQSNMEAILLEKVPKIAVYAPPNIQPWDDAVILALNYAEIPYTILWDAEVLDGELEEYDWLHLHHEDFTGQYGKFYASFRNAAWYKEQQALYERKAREAGFPSVSEHKKAVARKIKEYIAKGGFVFAMCSATDSFEIALAAEGIDIVDKQYDGDPPDPGCQSRLDYSKTLAFTGFVLEMNPLVYEYSDIDTSNQALARGPEREYFTLFEFSAKHDPVPTMLTQCHVSVVKGFLGQTTGFNRELVKESAVVMAEVEKTEELKYIHGNYGRGTFTFYGGHDPEDYRHAVGDPPTDLSLHKNSPGYRLILNNILFPAAEKKQQKT